MRLRATVEQQSPSSQRTNCSFYRNNYCTPLLGRAASIQDSPHLILKPNLTSLDYQQQHHHLMSSAKKTYFSAPVPRLSTIVANTHPSKKKVLKKLTRRVVLESLNCFSIGRIYDCSKEGLLKMSTNGLLKPECL